MDSDSDTDEPPAAADYQEVEAAAARGPHDWFRDKLMGFPPVTRAWLVLLALSTVGCAWQPALKQTLALHWPRVLRWEWWRLGTTFVCFGGQVFSARNVLSFLIMTQTAAQFEGMQYLRYGRSAGIRHCAAAMAYPLLVGWSGATNGRGTTNLAPPEQFSNKSGGRPNATSVHANWPCSAAGWWLGAAAGRAARGRAFQGLPTPSGSPPQRGVARAQLLARDGIRLGRGRVSAPCTHEHARTLAHNAP